MVGAVVVVEPEEKTSGMAAPRPLPTQRRPLAQLEILGRSVLDRAVDNLKAAGLASVSVIDTRDGLFDTKRNAASDLWQSATRTVIAMKEQRFDTLLIAAFGAHVEFRPQEMVRFRRQESASVVRACDEQGELPVWVMALSEFPVGAELKDYLEEIRPVPFPIHGYVNRLESLFDLRTLVADSLSSRCNLRPAGFEVKPGVWMAPGAQVERGARIVAPAFIGREVKVAEQCLVTRCSDLESNSQIDYGTVVEASSVLSDTYVGIGLDLSHSVVDGSHLENLRHEVTLEISDEAILRRVHESKTRPGAGRRLLANFNPDATLLSLGQENKR